MDQLSKEAAIGEALPSFQEEAIKGDTPYQVFKSMMLEQMGATVDKA